MKRVSIFLLLMLVLCVCLFAIDWLKSTAVLAEYRSFIPRFQTLFLSTGGILIMKITLQKQAFGFFMILYMSLWIIYFLSKLIIVISTGELKDASGHSHFILANYLKFTLLLTPFPFFFFWLLNRVYLLHFSAKEENEIRV